MSNIFFISDTHFGHEGILPHRPQFSCVGEMDEHMIQRWNQVVRHDDKVYHCGDVAFGRDALRTCAWLNGHKYLIMGNHDQQDMREYMKVFKKIFGVKYVGEYLAICTHIPVAPTSLRNFAFNIHGHMHTRTIDDERYINVSVEQIDYTPISLEEINGKRKTN